MFSVSLSLNLHTYETDPVANFYSPQTRFWELMAGAILAHFTMRESITFTGVWSRPAVAQNVCSMCGLSLILISTALITPADRFPGWLALLPVAGAVLLISGGQKSIVNRHLLSGRTMVWFGLISFPLYLWHWILLTFARIAETDMPSVDIRIATVLTSIALAWLTYKFVESPIRFGRTAKTKIVALMSLMPAIGLAGYVVYVNDGYSFRMKDREQYAVFFENSRPNLSYSEKSGVLEYYRNDCNFYDIAKYRLGMETNTPVDHIAPSCVAIQEGEKKTVFLWGDSHVQQLYYGLLKTLPSEWQVLIVASSGCPAKTDELEDSSADYCVRSNWYAMNTIREVKPDVVIIGQEGGHDPKMMTEIASDLKAAGVRKTVFTGPVPHWTTNLPHIILNKYWRWTPRRTLDGIDAAYLAKNDELKRDFRTSSGSVFVSLIDLLCNEDGCLTYLGDDRMRGVTSWDYAHLTLTASEFVAKGLLRDAVVGAN